MKPRLTNAERLHRALIAAAASLIVFATLHKLGDRGKYSKWDPSPTWAELLDVLPSLAVVSLLIGGIFYFWPGRPRD